MFPKLVVKIGADTKDLDKNLTKTQANLKKFAKAAKVGAVAAATAMTLMIKAGLKNIDAQAKLAQSLNTTVSSMQTLERAGDLAGVSMGSIEQATKDLTRRLSQAAGGAGPAVDALERLNLTAQALSDMPLDQRISTINDAIRDFIPAAEQAAVAGQLFGEEGSIMMARLDSATIRQAAADVAIYGGIVSEVDAQAVENANDALTRMGLIWEGLVNRLTVRVAPMLQAIASYMAETWISARVVGIAISHLGKIWVEQWARMENANDIFQNKFAIMTDQVKLYFVSMVNDIEQKWANVLSFFASGAENVNAFGMFDSMIAGAAEAQAQVAKTTEQISLSSELIDQMKAENELLASENKGPLASVDAMKDEIKTFIEETNAAKAASAALKLELESVDDVNLETVANQVKTVKKAVSETEVATESMQSNLKSIGDTMTSTMSDGIMAIMDGTKSAKDAFKDMAKSIIAKLYEILVVQQLVGSFTAGVDGKKGTGTGIAGAVMGVLGFEGGGFTGSGSRVGGVDGKGGFPAIVHPNETIIDHTKGQQMPSSGGGSVVVNQTINVTTGVQSTVRAEVMSLLPRIVEASKAGVIDARRRGGSFGAAF